MRHAGCLFLVALAVLTTCDRQPETVPLQVGDHSFSARLPKDWEHVDYGERHQLRREFERISIEDLQMTGRDLEGVAERAMTKLGHDGRREVASQIRIQVGGRSALAIDTWDPLSHEFRKSYVFVEGEAGYLVIYMLQGKYEAMETVFGEFLASLVFADSLAADADSVLLGGN